MESSSSSQQAEAVAQADVRQFLDLEAAVDRGGYDSEDDEGADGFINDDDDDVGRPVNYQALNRALDADDHDSLFSDQDSLFSEPQDESAGDDSVAVGGSGLVLDQGNTAVGGVALELDEDDPNVKRYRSQEVWSIKCKPYREQDVINFIVGYQKIHPEDNIFSLTRPGSCGSGYVYIQTQDSPRAASILRGCMYTRRTRTGGINGVHMTVLSDPLDILRALSMASSIAKTITGGVEKRQPDPKKPVLKAGVWVRLGPIEKPKKEPNSEEEASGPPRKKTRLDNPSTRQGLTEEDVPMGDIGDIHPQTEPEASGKPTRGQSYEPELPKPGKPLYYDDPALVLKAWDPTQYGKKRRRLTVYPDGGFQHGMRVQIVEKSMIKPLGRLPNSREGRILLKCSHPAVIGNFPPIEDWRFDIGEMVMAPTGQQGVVISHFPGGPVIQCYEPGPDNCDPASLDSLTTRVGEHCFGWKLIKSWLPGDFVRHVSGVEGFVIIPNCFETDNVLIKHPDNNVNHDFSGHANSFRLTPRHEKSQGYAFRREPETFHQTPWMEAAVRGPREITTRLDWQQFRSEWNEKLALRRLPQQVFVMDHVEASAKIKKARSGTIPWKDRRVLIYAKGRHNKGDVAQVYDVHIRQKTKSGLQITVESEVIGRQGQRQMYDYEDLVDEHWELPLHLVERPLNPAFHPKRNYIHSMTFHVKVAKLPPSVRSTTPPLRSHRPSSARSCSSTPDPAWTVSADDSNRHHPMPSTPTWQTRSLHPSQRWLYEAENTHDLWFKAKIKGEILGKRFNNKPENIRLVICDRDKTAVIEHYKKQHPLPDNVEVSPVYPISNTVDPIFIFRGEFANRVVYRSSSANYDGVRYLHGFEADIKGRTIDFNVKCKFLPTDACVLYVGTEIRDALGQYYKDRSNSNNRRR
ncbi:hypothetical protein WG66_009651 [Moniliophthora roreri]|nr:hypothetical protein WG66_009651 [Moniliophthora roreri]